MDLSELNPNVKGNMLRDRVMEQILLYGKGLLRVHKLPTDGEGHDLKVTKKGVFKSVFLHLKGGFDLQPDSTFIFDISVKAIASNHCYFVVGACLNPRTMEIHDRMLFLPLEIVDKNGVEVRTGGDMRRRITIGISEETQSKWAQYIIDRKDLANKILAKFQEIA